MFKKMSLIFLGGSILILPGCYGKVTVYGGKESQGMINADTTSVNVSLKGPYYYCRGGKDECVLPENVKEILSNGQ